MTSHSLTLEKLAAFNLKDLPSPEHGLTTEVQKKETKRSEQDIERIEDILGEEMEAIRRLVRATGLPTEMKSHPLYPPFLMGDFPEEGQRIPDESPLMAQRNLMAFIPLHPNSEGVIGLLNKIAKYIIAEVKRNQMEEEQREANTWGNNLIEAATQSVAKGLLRILDDNIRAMDEQPVLKNPRDTIVVTAQTSSPLNDLRERSSKPQGLKGFSTKKVRETAKEILKHLRPRLNRAQTEQDQEKVLQEACVKLMKDLGLVKKDLQNSEAEQFLNEIMPSCLSKAKDLYKEIGKKLQEAQEKFDIKGPQPNTNLWEENEYRTPIELFQILLGHSREPDAYATGDLIELSEAQSILALAFNFFLVRTHPLYKTARAKETAFRRRFVENFFGKKGKSKKESVEISFDNRRNVLPDEQKDKKITTKEEELRIIDESKMPQSLQKLRVYFDGSRRKTSTSLVKKILLNPNYELDRDIFDFLGARIFIWDLTLEKFKNSPEKETIRTGLYALAERAGLSMGLKLRHTNREKLKPGEFCIQDKLEENNSNTKSDGFPAMKVYGRTEDNLPIEFQIVLRDGYDSIKSPDSPNNVDAYELKKDLEICRIVKPSSLFPNEHEITIQALKILAEKSEAWFKKHPHDNVGTDSLN